MTYTKFSMCLKFCYEFIVYLDLSNNLLNAAILYIILGFLVCCPSFLGFLA